MLNQVSSKLAKVLIRKAKCIEYEEEVYVYGLELTLSTLAGFSAILVLSILFKAFDEGITFLFMFVPLRLYTGGYHSSTYGKCFLVSIISFVSIMIIRRLLVLILAPGKIFCLYLIITIYIAVNAPKLNNNQRINEAKVRRCKYIALTLLGIDSMWVMYLWYIESNLMYISILSVCLVAAFMLITDNKNKGE